ncbi:ABC transporter ATP-binding protein [Thermodesulforhabdus norvegica]|uniref:Simple sugar transport system ATP-binding protein n=1 Tax=Thermodesulforhabdus norvegica TaxID=39841 RepID=A0A1I4V1Y2_9BACT|nr:ATP-binding cassette domain-containing protein [Thermodesulforhabdus norvegica]SFM95010.1 simple sugar transport system ATP-binding protein [Thermodesulforhabdus norvegica]
MNVTLKGIHKFYGKVHANRGITVTFRQGTIHGILGENGAGKSTLMKILAGYVPRSDGTILIEGQPADYSSPQEALKHGIGMLYQDPLDFPALTALQNFTIGQPSAPFLSPEKKFKKIFQELAGHFNFSIQPDSLLENLSLGERQQLEIIRLVAAGAQLIILDEPTTGISVHQKEALFSALKQLASAGKTIVLVSHKLEDVMALCSEVSVLRQGECVGHMTAPFDKETLLKHMFGRVPAPVSRCIVEKGSSLLWMEGVSAVWKNIRIRRCSFRVKEGEIVGIAGLEGSGQAVLLRTAAGLIQPVEGNIYWRREQITGRERRFFKNKGIFFVPADRIQEGLFPDLTLQEHYALTFFEESLIIPHKGSKEVASERVRTFSIKGRESQRVTELSGGNQQRLMLSLLPTDPQLLLLEHPTRGLDIESASWLWKHLQRLSSKGAAIVFTSGDLDEIFSVAHRVVVFFEGRIVLDENVDHVSVKDVQKAMAGVFRD